MFTVSNSAVWVDGPESHLASSSHFKRAQPRESTSRPDCEPKDFAEWRMQVVEATDPLWARGCSPVSVSVSRPRRRTTTCPGSGECRRDAHLAQANISMTGGCWADLLIEILRVTLARNVGGEMCPAERCVRAHSAAAYSELVIIGGPAKGRLRFDAGRILFPRIMSCNRRLWLLAVAPAVTQGRECSQPMTCHVPSDGREYVLVFSPRAAAQLHVIALSHGRCPRQEVDGDRHAERDDRKMKMFGIVDMSFKQESTAWRRDSEPFQEKHGWGAQGPGPSPSRGDPASMIGEADCSSQGTLFLPSWRVVVVFLNKKKKRKKYLQAGYGGTLLCILCGIEGMMPMRLGFKMTEEVRPHRKTAGAGSCYGYRGWHSGTVVRQQSGRAGLTSLLTGTALIIAAKGMKASWKLQRPHPKRQQRGKEFRKSLDEEICARLTNLMTS
ncbi:uncharacterized protein EI97DRAFT_438898 [Westerdykella ornata]|uniref:Uncharacterized protein n=1 Tax=Westerdykella ornata TaxID=318751 RepID=A0A6A6K0J7_WESOR|nr:uncharacterized protein EI97DRAFT_438898 [Westerdykella ornata]KAF2281576.1 hypothetical protein EI97DRAFT_438898 [Westerdykella ornata]